MQRIICSFCDDEKFTASPDNFTGEIHTGCGGHFENPELEGCLGSCMFKAPLSIQFHITGKSCWCSYFGHRKSIKDSCNNFKKKELIK